MSRRCEIKIHLENLVSRLDLSKSIAGAIIGPILYGQVDDDIIDIISSQKDRHKQIGKQFSKRHADGQKDT